MEKRLVLAALAVFIGLNVMTGITSPESTPWAIATFWMVTAVMIWGWWSIATERRPRFAVWISITTLGLVMFGVRIAEQTGRLSTAWQIGEVALMAIGVVALVTIARRHRQA